jgi:hypothetical protein
MQSIWKKLKVLITGVSLSLERFHVLTFSIQLANNKMSNTPVLQLNIYRVSQEECARLREGVPYVKVYRYNPKHLYPNRYGDNGQRSLKI